MNAVSASPAWECFFSASQKSWPSTFGAFSRAIATLLSLLLVPRWCSFHFFTVSIATLFANFYEAPHCLRYVLSHPGLRASGSLLEPAAAQVAYRLDQRHHKHGR